MNQKSIMKVLVPNSLTFFMLFLVLVLSPVYAKDLDVLKEFSADKVITGKINTIHIDKFERKESHYKYRFLTEGIEYDLLPIGKNISFSPDTTFTIDGYDVVDDQIKVDVKNIKKTQEKENLLIAGNNAESSSPYFNALGEQKLLVFLVDFLNSTKPKPFKKIDIETMLFNGKQQDFFKEQSYNRMWLSGTVTPWITLNRNFDDNNWVTLDSKKIKDYILINNINLADYGRILFIVDHPSATGGYSYVGKGDVFFEGKNYILSQSWAGSSLYGRSIQVQTEIPFSYFDYTISHELGHAFGVMHANGWDCSLSSVDGVCEHLEYENNFDTMGYPNFSFHFNAFYKNILKWIPARAVEEIRSSGRYSLSALETSLAPDTSSKKIAKIFLSGPTGETMPYALEFRKSIGLDKGISSPDMNLKGGLFVHKINIDTENYHFSSPEIIDTTPSIKVWYDDIRDGSLRKDNVFIDKEKGIKIGPILFEDGKRVEFMVEYFIPN